MRQDNSLSASLGGERTGSSTLARNRHDNVFGKQKDEKSPVNMNFAERANQQDPHLTYNRQSRPITSQDYTSKGKQRLSGDPQGDRNPYNQTQFHNFNNLRGSQGSSEANRTLKDNIEELKQKKLRSIEQTPQESVYDINFKSRLITPTNATQDRSQATSHFNFQNQNDDGENQDLEQQLMGLQGKIQNLEGKYIDLANFYKQGALRGKVQNSSTAQGSRSSTAENFYPNRGSSPLREFDQIQEKSIINELIKEKSDLEKELQNIISLQGTLIQQDQRISEKIDNLNKNYSSSAQYFSNQQTSHQAMQNAEIIVEKYEKDLILYINQNYNSFTEKDISSIFNQLKTELLQLYGQEYSQRDQVLSQIVVDKQFHFIGQKSFKIQQISTFSNEELIKILNEFEINQQYSQQDLKKVIFDAQSKLDLMLLDLKKSNMILQNLSKSINEFDQDSLRQRPSQYSNTSPNRKPMNSDEYIHDMQIQVKSLQQTFSQLQQKVTSSGDEQFILDFRLIMATPEKFAQNFMQFKLQIESITPQQQLQLPIDNDKAFEIMKEELMDLRNSNQQLTSDLKFATERSTLVIEENQQLRQHVENLDKRREASPINMIRRGMEEFTRENNSRQCIEKQISNPDRSNQRDKEFQQLQRELRLINEQNLSLHRQVQQLSRSLLEKENEIDRLGRDLSKISQLNTLQTISQHKFENEPQSNVSMDQLNFYKSFADQQIMKLKNLIRQTQKFLYAMKKLQKAVHKKQPNVQNEKGDFEVTRKELEYMLKDLKKEVDENINANAEKKTISSRLDVQGFRDNKNQRDQAHFNVRESLDQPNYRSLSNMGSSSQYKRRETTGLSYPQSQNQTILASHSFIPQHNESHQREISPIMLRQRDPIKRNDIREQFRSIDPEIRGTNQTLLSTLSIDRQHRSPSVEDPRNERLQIRYQSPSLFQNQQQDNDYLHRQISDMRREKDMLDMRINRLERDKDQTYLEKQQIEIEHEKTRRQLDILRQEYDYVLEQKDQLSTELQRIIDSLHGDDKFNDQGKRIKALEQQNEDEQERYQDLAQQLQVTEKLSFEQKRTITIMEESAETAKERYMDLKETIEDKETTIKELKEKIDQMRKVKTSGDNSEQNKQQLKEQIELIEKDSEEEKQKLNDQIQSRDQEIQNLKRKIEKINKEHEIQIQNLIQKENKAVSDESKHSDLEKQLAEKDLEIKRLERQLAKEMDELRSKNLEDLSKQKDTFKNEVSQINATHKAALESEHNKHKESLKYAEHHYQQQIAASSELHKQQLVADLQKLSSQNQQSIEGLKQSYEQQISDIKVHNGILVQNLEKKIHEIQQQQVSSESQQITKLRNELQQEQKQKLQEANLKDKNIKDLRDNIIKIQASHQEQLQEIKLQCQEEIESLSEKNQVNEEQWQAAIEQKDSLIKNLDAKVKNLQKDHAQKLDAISQQIKQKDDQLVALQNENSNVLNEIKQLQEQQTKSLLMKQKELESLKSSIDSNNQQYQQEISLKEQKVSELNTHTQHLEDQISMIKSTLTNKEELLLAQLEQLQEQLKQKDQNLQDMSQNMSLLNAKLNGKDKKIHDIDQKHQEMERNYRKANKEVSDVLSARRKSDGLRDIKISNLEKDINLLKEEKTKAQEKMQGLQDQFQSDKDELQAQIDQLKVELQKSQNEEASLLQQSESKTQEVEEMKQIVKDVESESSYAKQLKQKIQQQLDNLISEKQQISQSHQSNLEDLQMTISGLHKQQESKDKALSTLQQEIQAEKTIFTQDSEKYQQQIRKQENKTTELLSTIDHQRQDITNARLDIQELAKSKDKQISELALEKQKAQDQLRDMVQHQTFEKLSAEESLQKQLNLALEQIQLKEKDLQSTQNKLDQAQGLLKESQRNEQEYQNQLKQLEEENEQYQLELQENEEERGKHQQALENNRSLITMLKNELQKSIDKQKHAESSQNENQQSKEAELQKRIITLEGQIQNLRQDFEDKQLELKLQIDTLETDLQGKNQLVEEANECMEEFNDEKHQIKAKFKHLMQILDSVIDESSYKEEDEVDLEKCFERFEEEFMKHKQRIEDRIESLINDNSILRQESEASKDELNQLQIKMAGLQADLMNAVNKLESNDIEVRKKLDNASKKVQQYKDKVVDKQQIIMGLENKLKELVDYQQQQSDHQDSNRASFQQEKIMLEDKLNKANTEILSLKQLQSSLSQGIQDRVTYERLDQLEQQLMNLRKLIFLAKDQVIETLSETFAMRIKEMTQTFNNDNILKAKLSEMKTETQISALNNNIKMMKYISFGNKKMLIVQVISNNECYIIDESKLTEACQAYLKQFLPANLEQEVEKSLIKIDEKQQQILDDLQKKMRGIADQRNQHQIELINIKQKLGRKPDIQSTDVQQLKLEDELESYQIKLKETELQLAEIKQQNLFNRQRIIELNDMIKEITQSADAESANRKVIKLLEDNESLRQQLMSSQTKERRISRSARQISQNEEEEEDIEEGIFMEGIQVADNANRSQDDAANLFDQSSIYGVIEGLNEGEAHVKTQQDQKIHKLEQQLNELESRNKTLQTEVQRSQQQTLNPVDQGILENIKGTLIQFLKNCPLTEKNNEVLLEIIFSMMEFTEDEKTLVQDKRKQPRSASARSNPATDPEEEVKKAAKKGIFGMFKKKEKVGDSSNTSSTRKPEEMFSPMRPIRRV